MVAARVFPDVGSVSHGPAPRDPYDSVSRFAADFRPSRLMQVRGSNTKARVPSLEGRRRIQSTLPSLRYLMRLWTSGGQSMGFPLNSNVPGALEITYRWAVV